MHGFTVWVQARTEYLSGDPAARVCARHGLNLSTFYDRAKREGWRRLDVLEEKVWTLGDEYALDPSCEIMAARAWLHAARAIERGSRTEARSWLLVARDLNRHAFDAAGSILPDGLDAPATAPAFTPRDGWTRSPLPDPLPEHSESHGQNPEGEKPASPTAWPSLSEHTDTPSLPSGSGPELPALETPAVSRAAAPAPPEPAPPERAPPQTVDEPSAYCWSPAGMWVYTDAFIAALRRKPHRDRTDREVRIVSRANAAEYRVVP